MRAETLRAEAEAFVAGFADETPPDGRQRAVRHGHALSRSVQTGIGPIEVTRPKVGDRTAVPSEEKIHQPRRSCRAGRVRRGASTSCCHPRPAGRFDRSRPGGAGGASRQGCAEPVCVGDQGAHGAVGRRVRGLAAARPLGLAQRPCLRRRRPSPGPHGAERGVHARRDRRHAGGGRSWSASSSAPARAPGAGASCSQTSRRAGSPSAPTSRSATVRSASARRWRSSSPRSVTSGAGRMRS
jgi:hypothetical protein